MRRGNLPHWFRPGGKYNKDAYDKARKHFYTAAERRERAEINEADRELDAALESIQRQDIPPEGGFTPFASAPHCGPGNSIGSSSVGPTDDACREHDIGYDNLIRERGSNDPYWLFNDADQVLIDTLAANRGAGQGDLPGYVAEGVFRAKKAVMPSLRGKSASGGPDDSFTSDAQNGPRSHTRDRSPVASSSSRRGDSEATVDYQDVDFDERMDLSSTVGDNDLMSTPLAGSAVGGVGGNPAGAVVGKTPQIHRMKYSGGTKTIVMESSYRCMMKSDAGWAGKKRYFVPWELPKQCHSHEEVQTKFDNTIFWQYVGAECSISDAEAYAELPIGATSHWPVSMSNIRMRYFKPMVYHTTNRSVFDSKEQWDTWQNVLKDQSDGTIVTELPTMNLEKFLGHGNDANQLAYNVGFDQQEWVSKRVTEGEVFTFRYAPPKRDKVWRHTFEMYEPVWAIIGGDEKGQSDTVLNFMRVDSLIGAFDTPLSSRATSVSSLGATLYWEGCYTNRSYTRHAFENMRATINNTDKKEFIFNHTNSLKTAKVYGPYIRRINCNNALPWHFSDSPMPPIILEMTPTMNGTNVQPVQIFFKVTIKHVFKAMIMPQFARNNNPSLPTKPYSHGSDEGYAPLGSLYGMDQHYRFRGRAIEDDITKKTFNNYKPFFPVFNPQPAYVYVSSGPTPP